MKEAFKTVNESKELLKERLNMIMNYHKKSKFIVSITLVVTIIFCAGATSVGAYAATNTHDSSTPWLTMGGTGQTYTYSQAEYYQGAYIFELGWNLNEKGSNAYPDKAEFILSDLTTITVSFDKSCKNETQDQAVLTDLKELIERLKTQYSDSTLSLEKPLVVSVEYVGDSDLVKLAEEYYTNGKHTKFYAIFSSLDKDIQEEYCIKMIEGEENAFLAGTAKFMESDMIAFCLEKTYQEGKIALFAGVVPNLSKDQKETWIARASRDDKNSFLAVLTR